MRTFLLSSIAGAALVAGGGLAAAPMETAPGHATGAYQNFPQNQPGALQNPSQRHAELAPYVSPTDVGGPRSTEGMDRGYSVAMGARGPESGRSLQERRSVATVGLSSDQKARLHAIVAGGNLYSVAHVNFASSVGTRIPRTMRIYGVPQSIVDIVPQYRGFDYIVVKNDLLIIDPGTLEIMYIFPR